MVRHRAQYGVVMGFTTEPRFPPSGVGAQRRRLFVVRDGVPLPERARISVLYLEDDDDDVFLIGHQLSALASFDVDLVHVPTIEAARHAVAQRGFDVILCDFWLASETTVPFIAELKAAAAGTPVVLVSSLDNDDIDLIGRRAGADGFVNKADLSAASIDRVFNTLLRPARDDAPRTGGIAVWLKALMKSLDRAQSAPGPDRTAATSAELDEVVEALFGPSDATRSDLLDKLAGLERATEADRDVARFDVVPHLRHGVHRQMRRCHGNAIIVFAEPELPVSIEARPALFGDLLDGFLAEAGDAVASGTSVTVSLAVGAGILTLTLTAVETPAGDDGDGPLVAAAASQRRLLVETLAAAGGGAVVFPSGGNRPRIATLELPLRQ